MKELTASLSAFHECTGTQQPVELLTESGDLLVFGAGEEILPDELFLGDDTMRPFADPHPILCEHFILVALTAAQVCVDPTDQLRKPFVQ